jgi:hypothetical protein
MPLSPAVALLVGINIVPIRRGFRVFAPDEITDYKFNSFDTTAECTATAHRPVGHINEALWGIEIVD